MSEEPIAFEINGVAYQARRMDLLTQLAIVTKLGPLMASGLAQILQLFDMVASEIPDSPAVPEAKTAIIVARVLSLPKDELLRRLGPLTAELAKMPQEDQKFILANTLALVQKNNGAPGGVPQWGTVWPAGLPEPAFPEFRTGLILTLRVVGTVLAATLGPFTPGNR